MVVSFSKARAESFVLSRLYTSKGSYFPWRCFGALYINNIMNRISRNGRHVVDHSLLESITNVKCYRGLSCYHQVSHFHIFLGTE